MTSEQKATHGPEESAAEDPNATFWPLKVFMQCKRIERGLWEVDSWSALRVESDRGQHHDHQSVESFAEKDATRIHCWRGLGLELYRDERAAYRFNLSAEQPRLFVICTEDEDEGGLMRPYLISASQDAASSYMDGGEEDVFSVPMPPAVQCWIEAFIAVHGEPDLGLSKGKRRRYRGARKEEAADE